MTLPQPAPEALAHSQQLQREIARRIAAAGGWLSFADFMAAALYAPGLGYYTAWMQKFGASGDFVTAPELTPLFARTLARQAAQIMSESAPHILEAGAGSGRLAADLLCALEAQDALPETYSILEISTDLRQRQRELLARQAPHLLNRIIWLDDLPARFSGLVLGNELLDAIPVHCVAWQPGEIFERGITLDAAGQFQWQSRPATGRLLQAAEAIAGACPLPPGFESEVALAAPAWAAAWGERLTQGCLLLMDYGFPRHEFYHPDRNSGTLMCHYRHHAHPDPLILAGLQDITAHVDFTALIETAYPAGLELLGYTHQAQFLLNCGLLDDLATLEPASLPYIKATVAVQKLIAPQEMGELFKVMAMGKNIDAPLIGFARGDKSHTL
ncbi:SAM-dependent methyltransferase [Betaproteobacteria bacterium]|nr:SAM-dependent methyltransferase [Betaproteobacteria bacterium]GHU42711.1 SAM-dependent methyltransferase [Betaproteobacteria bacterium]